MSDIAFNPNCPPLLKSVSISDILKNKIVSGPSVDSQGAFLVDPWYWLRCAGGQLVHILDGVPFDPLRAAITYLGISTPERGIMLNPDGAAYPLTNASVIVGANVRQTPEWHLVEGPRVYATEQTVEIMQGFSTDMSTLRSFESSLEASVEATASASGLGMSASVTAGLKTTVTTGIQTQTSIQKTFETKTTETIKADTAYATWILYNKVEITYGADILSDNKVLTHEQLAGLNPGVLTYYISMMPWEDSCGKDSLPS